MERSMWSKIVELVGRERAGRPDGRFTFTDTDIVLTYLWAVLHDRPISWACRASNWPIYEWRRAHPTPSTMTRRLRSESVRSLFDTLVSRLGRSLGRDDLVFAVDAKPLPIGGASGDPDARFGRAARGKAKGYKLHVIAGESGAILAHEVWPMNVDERPVARSLIRRAAINDVLLGDGNYDTNYLYDEAGVRGVQLIAPKRYPDAKGLGHHRHSRWRIRCLDALAEGEGSGAATLLERRGFIERTFGNLVSAPSGLGDLPAWVRRLQRVRRWVKAKLMLFMLGRTATQQAE